MNRKLKLSIEKNEEEMKKWRAGVLRQFIETNKLTEATLKEGKTARERLTKDLDETKAVVNRWNEYSEKYKSSVRQFAKRIEENEPKHLESCHITLPNSSKEIRSITDPKVFFHRRNLSACRPTKSYLVKTRKKYVEKSHLRSFQF
eukprot:CAMPEP_0168324408 /NCGR_PEP_ID=MMETSP0213-20121227/4069_1 /TAXON_ID=151035 /ORGANISM="Euplotes harpa, Strain FSP1.4" /LENGTH=145 /DNA_ID=CAMNT_0008326685 /DNA_START=184 /DNA_END=621 /DNA_ORIENTATION=+